MKKILLLAVLCCSVHAGFGQKKIEPTKSFTVEGNIKNQSVVTPKELSSFEQKEIGDVAIKNHLGEVKHTITRVKGVLLKDVLNKTVLNSESPKDFSQYYIICTASDGYTVVFSWNELFNSPTGDNTYVITSRDGQSISQMDDHIALITPTDFNTGRRYVKCLAKITINKVP
jgi:hypothetical protein